MEVLKRVEIGRFAVVAILILSLIVAALFLPRLLSSNNVLQVLRQASIPRHSHRVSFVVSGRLDLSVGSMLSLCSVADQRARASVPSPVFLRPLPWGWRPAASTACWSAISASIH